MVSVILACGGSSTRMGGKNKLFMQLGDMTVIERTILAFDCINEVDEIIISCSDDFREEFIKSVHIDFEKKIRFAKNGHSRQQSVFNGFEATSGTSRLVCIHDGARPMITTELINRAIEMVKEKKALTVATKTIDTIKEVVDGKIVRTIDRSKLYNTQTPQAFEYKLIKEAHEKLYGQNFTDDAGMLEELGETVYILDGSYKNIKITTQNDIDIAAIYLEKNKVLE